MKYSIIGRLNGILPGSSQEQSILDTANSYNPLWRLRPYNSVDDNGIDIMRFEIWLEFEADKQSCFVSMKSYVDTYTGEVSWHECTHDEPSPVPCVISESYAG